MSVILAHSRQLRRVDPVAPGIGTHVVFLATSVFAKFMLPTVTGRDDMKSLQAQTLFALFLLCSSFPYSSIAALALDAQEYGARWSVVVGTNYDSFPPGTPLSKLKFAEADAKEFHDRLVNNYGFAGENATLLLGAAASRDAIIGKLEEVCNNAGEDDCVVVYFSGHGYLRGAGSNDPTKDSSHSELLPSDVQFKGATPTSVKVVEMKAIIDYLGIRCKARHRLLILDCCYSGDVFSLGRGASVFDATRVEDGKAFSARGFQAMTASRAEQKAADGRDGHSPFTAALLEALVTIPTMQKKKAFTTTELFSGMQWFLDQNLGREQSPRCSWLDGGQGDLHFFPKGDFPDPNVPDDQIRKVMLAMVPGSFGHWWFEETPWFMPGLRYELVAADEDQRSLDLEMISQTRLERAALEIRNKYKGQTNDMPTRVRDRVRHLDMLLNARGDEWDKTVKHVICDLENATGTRCDAAKAEKESSPPDAPGPDAKSDIAAAPTAPAPVGNKNADEKGSVAGHDSAKKIQEKQKRKEDVERALDLHYLAVLKQASREKTKVEQAKAHYDDALRLYKEAAEHSQQYKPLLALCKADRGWYDFSTRDYEGACQNYAEARSVYGSLTPKPFQVYVLCREAEALSKLGRTRAAKRRIEEAQAASDEVDPNGAFPLTAALFNSKAWLEMNWCEFPEAIADFNTSTKILKKPANAGHESRIMCLHNAHGIAMAHRYSGESNKAVEMYRSLLKDEIHKQLRDMRESVGRDPNYKQTKTRLTDRWQNTLERCGDCSLFGEPRDVAEAADDYRRALRAAGYLPAEMAANRERRMRVKWALALALPNSGVQDPELAEEQLKEIEAIKVRLPTSQQPLETYLEISKKLTELILAHCRLSGPNVEQKRQEPIPSGGVAKDGAATDCCDNIKDFNTKLTDFRRYLTDLAKTNLLESNLNRDDIETAMFAMRVILNDLVDSTPAKPAAGERTTRLKDVELLLDFCRLGRRAGVEALHFVRPYYDCAIAALIKLEPKNTKQLVEVSWEAMTGKAHFKPHGHGATLVFYSGADTNYFFLDVPRGTSAIFPLHAGIDLEKVRLASHGENPATERLVLPDALRKELSALNGDICLCWRDHVKELGTSHAHEHNVAKMVAPETLELPLTVALATSHPGEVDQPNYRFPFVMPDSVRAIDAWLAESAPDEEASVPAKAAP